MCKFLFQFKTQVKVMTEISKIQFGALYAKKHSKMQKIQYPSTLDERFEINSNLKLKFEIHLRSIRKPNFIVIEFVDETTDEVVLQVIPKKRQEKYQIMVDVNKHPFKKKFGINVNGNDINKYRVNLLIGDALYAKSIVWSNILSIDCAIEEDDEDVEDYEPVDDVIPKYAPQEAIAHTFAESAEFPNIVISWAFSVIVLLPFLLFLYLIIGRMGIRFSFGNNGVYGVLFVVNMVVIGLILFLYWWQWNIFQAGGYLSVACIPGAIFAYNILKVHLKQRLESKKFHKE